MSYDFLKKALNIKSPSETENPNSEYVPPGCEPKNSNSCSITTDWTDYITITHKMSYKLFHAIKNTVAYHRVTRYCRFRDISFIVEQSMTQPKYLIIVFGMPAEKYVPFDTSDDYRVFIQTLIDLAQKKLAPEKPKYFSGKIVCITAATPQFTTGKIYDVVNGNFRDDKGFLYPCNHSIEEINSTNTSQFIELVE